VEPAVPSSKRLLLLALLTASVTLAWTSEAAAQYRRGPVVVRPVVVRPYPYYGFYDPFWYDPFFDAQWGVYGPYGYPPYRYNVDPGAAVKLEVKPKKAEVYVDGYYAGIVDDFDGAFQRLRIRPGEHDIELYLDGYRTVHQKVYLTPDNTFKLKYDMEKLGAGEQPEPRPQPPQMPPQAGAPGPGYQPPPYPQQPPQRGPGGRRAPQQPPPPPPSSAPMPRAGSPSGFGSIAVRVQPGDADILVDGERWRAPEGEERLVIDLPEGRHTIEIRKSGYRTYVTDIDVRRGETTPVNVSLRSQEEQ
jgi:hypothetical protein